MRSSPTSTCMIPDSFVTSSGAAYSPSVRSLRFERVVRTEEALLPSHDMTLRLAVPHPLASVTNAVAVPAHTTFSSSLALLGSPAGSSFVASSAAAGAMAASTASRAVHIGWLAKLSEGAETSSGGIDAFGFSSGMLLAFANIHFLSAMASVGEALLDTGILRTMPLKPGVRQRFLAENTGRAAERTAPHPDAPPELDVWVSQFSIHRATLRGPGDYDASPFGCFGAMLPLADWTVPRWPGATINSTVSHDAGWESRLPCCALKIRSCHGARGVHAKQASQLLGLRRSHVQHARSIFKSLLSRCSACVPRSHIAECVDQKPGRRPRYDKGAPRLQAFADVWSCELQHHPLLNFPLHRSSVTLQLEAAMSSKIAILVDLELKTANSETRHTSKSLNARKFWPGMVSSRFSRQECHVRRASIESDCVFSRRTAGCQLSIAHAGLAPCVQGLLCLTSHFQRHTRVEDSATRNAGRDRAPRIFGVHGAEGDALGLTWSSLAQHCSGYEISSLVYDAQAFLQDTVPALSSLYSSRLLAQVGDDGPVCLVAMSLGCVVAHQMAMELPAGTIQGLVLVDMQVSPLQWPAHTADYSTLDLLGTFKHELAMPEVATACTGKRRPRSYLKRSATLAQRLSGVDLSAIQDMGGVMSMNLGRLFELTRGWSAQGVCGVPTLLNNAAGSPGLHQGFEVNPQHFLRLRAVDAEGEHSACILNPTFADTCMRFFAELRAAKRPENGVHAGHIAALGGQHPRHRRLQRLA